MIKNASELSQRTIYFTLQYKVNKYKVQLAVYTPVGNKKKDFPTNRNEMLTIRTRQEANKPTSRLLK